MLPILAITLPIFLLVGLGYIAVRREVLSADQNRGVGRFVMWFALPALVFRSLSQRPLREIMDGHYLAVYALGSLTAMACSFAYFRFRDGLSAPSSALRGLGMSCSNSGFIGYPVALQFLGPAAVIPLALTMIVENGLIIPSTLALAESGEGRHSGARAIVLNILGNLARTPLIVAICVGLAFSLLGLHPPAPVNKAVDMLAGASAPCALFVIGGSLVGLRLNGMIGPIAQIAAGKLLLHPLAVLLVLQIIPIANPSLRQAAVLFASAPMLSVFPIFGQKYDEQGFCAAALLVTTTTSFLTISVFLWLIQTGWLH